MTRPQCTRTVNGPPDYLVFKPAGIPGSELEEVVLTVDEFEALRLADREGLYYDEAAGRMNISRQTFGRIIQSARQKAASALVEGKALRIEGGTVTMTGKRIFLCNGCGHDWEAPFGTGRPSSCPECRSRDIHRPDNHQGPDGTSRCRRGGACRRTRAKE